MDFNQEMGSGLILTIMWRQTAKKCSSSSTENSKRPWYNGPVPAVRCAKCQRRAWVLVSQHRYVERSPSPGRHEARCRGSASRRRPAAASRPAHASLREPVQRPRSRPPSRRWCSAPRRDSKRRRHNRYCKLARIAGTPNQRKLPWSRQLDANSWASCSVLPGCRQPTGWLAQRSQVPTSAPTPTGWPSAGLGSASTGPPKPFPAKAHRNRSRRPWPTLT